VEDELTKMLVTMQKAEQNRGTEGPDVLEVTFLSFAAGQSCLAFNALPACHFTILSSLLW
jgi:hypothetical protein